MSHAPPERATAAGVASGGGSKDLEGAQPEDSVHASDVYELHPSPKVAAAQLIVILGSVRAHQWFASGAKAVNYAYRPPS